MRRAIILALGTVLVDRVAGPSPLRLAGRDGPILGFQAAYKVRRVNALGQPDLGEYWTNASMTPESRPGAFGDRLVYTPQEVRHQLERAPRLKEIEVGNQKTDPNAPPPSVGGDKPAAGTRPEFAAAGGNVGGSQHRLALDPGNVVMRVHGEPRTSIITTTNGRAPAFKAGNTAGGAARAGYGGGLGSFDNPEQRSLGERCILSFGRNAGPPMLANGFYNNDYQFVQGKDTIAITVEMVHDVRVVRLNATHRTDGLRPYMGDSIGHWEGATLVVETTNIPQAQAYHGSWKNLTVTERFTRVAKDRLLYQFSINDPTMWDAAWGGEYEFAPMKGILYEYACHEGNYALEDMLAGARAEEAAKIAKATPAPASATVAN